MAVFKLCDLPTPIKSVGKNSTFRKPAAGAAYRVYRLLRDRKLLF
jgi:hypothetical protein